MNVYLFDIATQSLTLVRLPYGDGSYLTIL